MGSTTAAEEVHNDGLSSLGTGAGSSSCPGPGSVIGSSAEPRKFATAQFDVFLNHRGPDLKKTFVSHLGAALCRVGCEPFLDVDALVEGHHAFDCINDALAGALVHVAIFSPGYAESKYCLDELCDMLASEKPLIPVFYNVEPGNLRWVEDEKGPFAKAFSHHMERGRHEDVVKWKGALERAAAITGFRFGGNDNEKELVDKVVAAVWRELPAALPIPPACHPVGLKRTSMDVVEMLHNMGDNVGVLGIWGMGGIGKTTLAREVYNQEQARYESRCFLGNVKDAKGFGDIRDLQMKLVEDLLGVDARKMIGDYARLLEAIQKKKVLLVVDDISNMEQFVKLIPDVERLAPGSRVLITSRGSDILHRIMANVPQAQRGFYWVQGLNPSDSLELFISHAFRKKRLSEVDVAFHDKVMKVTEACGGVPLALEVMGGFLANKENEPECWAEAIDVLRKEGDIMEKLKISYDGLSNDDEKDMFLDIACIMLGHSKEKVLKVWKSAGYETPNSALRKLIDKCLVKVDVEGRLEMHDLVRDMGRKVVMDRANRKLEMQTHVWEAAKARRILQKSQNLNEVVRALSLVRRDPTSTTYKAEAYAKMRELRYLLLDDGCEVDGNFSEWSEELRWLQWRYFPRKELPESLNLQNLAVLDLSHSMQLTRVWAKDIEIEFTWDGLQMLLLGHCSHLEEMPQHMNKLVKLQVLDMEGCLSLSSLPESLGELRELEQLNLAGCSKLTRLPDLTWLGSLQKLNLQNCERLRELPRSISEMSLLEELNVGGCRLLENLSTSVHELKNLKVLVMSDTALKELPWNFGQLCSLVRAHFKGCKRLLQLPASIGSLSNLEELWLDGCELIRELPLSICKLTKLKQLDMRNTALEGLPEEFGQLCSLQKAYFNGCKRLVQLPASIGSLSNLEELWLDGCELIRELPLFICKLIKLKNLDMSNTALKGLPEEFGQLCSLERAVFNGCKRLVQLPALIGSLSNLETLQLNECELMQELLPSVCKLRKLKKLTMSNTALEGLPEEFGQLCNLQTAAFNGCKRLVQFPASIGSLSNLEELWLNGCELIQELPLFICKLTKLKQLDMSNTALEGLPEEFGQLCSLERAAFHGCKRLVQLPASIGSLSNLDDLRLDECELIRELPPTVCKLTKLMWLNMRNTALEGLPAEFGQLCSLLEAYFDGCKRLVQLPASIGDLSNLEELWLGECELIRELPPSICKLTKLKVLDICNTALEGLPEEFGQLHSLQGAYFYGCKRLVQLPSSIGSLSNLEVLWLDGCELLRELPPSICNLTKLGKLDMWNAAFEGLPEGFGQLCSLQKAYFIGWKRLVRLPTSFGSLSNLEELRLDGCELIRELPPSVCKLTKLNQLDMRSTALEGLPEEFGQLCSLEGAYFDGCSRLVQLPASIGSLSNLETLQLDGCELIRMLPPSICNLTKLKQLDMSNTALEGLPEEFGQLCSLQEAYFNGCKKLMQLPASIGSLSNLERLGLKMCELIRELPPSMCNLTNLKVIVLEELAWGEVPCVIGRLCSLEEVYFSFSKSLIILPGSLWELSYLEVLHLDGCELIQELSPSICLLKKLREICLNCMTLEGLPEEFGKLDNLIQADFEDCSMLQKLCDSFGCLGKLQKLNLKGCSRLIQLPESFSKLSNLESLDLRGCRLLQEYPKSTVRFSILVDGDVGV